MPEDERHSGIPTRAIHEAYLDMQRALKRYRQARDVGTESQIDNAHGDVQESVLTLYELLRPHIKHNDAVRDYWDGEPPRYDGNEPPDPEEGKAVLQVQHHNEAVGWENVPIDPQEKGVDELRTSNLEDWHEYLDLNGTVRLTGVRITKDGLFLSSQRYQLGLRQLDSWMTEFRTTQTELGGFLGNTTTESKERVRVSMEKLKRAARELSDVAERLGALSEFDATTPRTEITEEDMEKVEQWRQNQIND